LKLELNGPALLFQVKKQGDSGMIEHSYNADTGKCPDCGMEIKSGVVNKAIEVLKDQTYCFI
jgi:hypothetical protein